MVRRDPRQLGHLNESTAHGGRWSRNRISRARRAARHLAELSPSDFVNVIAGNLSDASWEAVILAAFEQKVWQRQEHFLDEVNQVVAERGDQQLIRILRSWLERASEGND
jgi:hypothetical protein